MDRSETVKQETVDRLSPLTNTITTQFGAQPVVDDLEKFTVDIDVDSNGLLHSQNPIDLAYLYSNAAGQGNIRRHTVGPGDVAHEQALCNNPHTIMNFKFDYAVGPNQIPINLPMLQNQPLYSFTVKDQNLLKPPIAMGASK